MKKNEKPAGGIFSQPLDKLTEQFMEGNKIRREALEQIQKVIFSAASGKKLGLQELVELLDRAIFFLKDIEATVGVAITAISRLTHNAARNAADLVEIYARVRTIVLALKHKGIITEKELAKIYNEETLEEMLASSGITREQVEEMTKSLNPDGSVKVPTDSPTGKPSV